jgi:outer membrane immunogenic protein
MKRLLAILATLIALPAAAADLKLPVKALPLVADQWVGFYLGINAGYGFDLSGIRAAQPPFFNGAELAAAPQGFAGGVQAGYNFRLLPGTLFLQSIEAEINGGNFRGSAVAPGFVSAQSNLNWFGSAGARIGVTIFPNMFNYGFIGVAYGDPTDTFTLSNFVNTGSVCAGACSASAGGTQTGVAWGFGTEFALDQHLKLGFDWRRYDFGTFTSSFTPVGTTVITFNPVERFDVIRARLNYSF